MRGIRELLNITDAREKTRGVICSAIRSRRLIEFFYHGGYRTVEPFCLGLVMSGDINNESLLCFQTGGFSELREVVGWKLYRASELEDIEVLNDTFVGDRPGYDPDAVDMVKIYCCVTPVAGSEPVVEPEPIEELPRYEVSHLVIEEPPVEEPLPHFEEAPEDEPRYLIHNELVRLFRLGHAVPVPGFYPGPLSSPLPEGTGWEFRHFMQMFWRLSLLGQNA